MSALRATAAIGCADLRQRMRTPRFWIVVFGLGALMWWCLPAAEADYLTVSVGEGLRGRYSSAWIGMVMALLYSPLLSLAGFYLVRGSVARDLDTRTWELLVTTTMSRRAYLLAKWLSHMAVFAGVLVVGLSVALVLQFLRAEDTSFHLVELVKPTLLITVPALGLTAALAVWFDLVPWLRRSAGNVIFFVVFMVMMGVGASQANRNADAPAPFPGDFLGLTLAEHELSRWPEARDAQARRAREGAQRDGASGTSAATPGKSLGLSVGTQLLQGRAPTLLEWKRWPVPADTVKARLLWLASGVVLLLAATPLLDRFAARRSAATNSPKRGATLKWLDWLLEPVHRSGRTGALLAAELRLVLRSRRWWWWLAMAVAFIVQLTASDKGMAMAVLAGWLLSLDVFSRLVLREHDTRTGALVFTAPGTRALLLCTRIAVAAGLAWTVTAPALLRLAIGNPVAALATLAAGASVAVWGLAIGAVFRNARPFELALLVAAYASAQGALVLNTLVAPQTTLLWHAASLPLALGVLVLAWRQGVAARA